jgi:PAS domain S-box-containing protein
MTVRTDNSAPALRSKQGSARNQAELVVLQGCLRELEAKQRDLEWLINSVDGIVWEGLPGTFEFSFVSRQAERLLGYPIDQWYTANFWLDHVHPDDRQWAAEFCTSEVRAGRAHDFEYRMIAADGRVVWLRDIVSLTADSPPLVHGIMVDITARKEAEAELRASYQQVQQLAGSLIQAKEAERTRIARDLHDGISQQLATASVGLSVLSRQLTSDQKTVVRRLLATLEQSIVTVRTLSHELHPAVLRHSGLIAALTSHCNEFRFQHSTEVSLAMDVAEVRGEAALNLFRIAQEALHNVAKHARASRVRVSLRRIGGEIELSIEDDGQGFDPAPLPRSSGLGLISIEERVRQADGRLELKSTPGASTCLTVRVPIDATA